MATGVEELLDMLFEMIDEAKSMPLQRLESLRKMPGKPDREKYRYRDLRISGRTGSAQNMQVH